MSRISHLISLKRITTTNHPQKVSLSECSLPLFFISSRPWSYNRLSLFYLLTMTYLSSLTCSYRRDEYFFSFNTVIIMKSSLLKSQLKIEKFFYAIKFLCMRVFFKTRLYYYLSVKIQLKVNTYILYGSFLFTWWLLFLVPSKMFKSSK